MRVIFVVIFAFLPFVSLVEAKEIVRPQIIFETAAGRVLIEKITNNQIARRSVVLILSGSKGFVSSAYDEIGHVFDANDMDAYLIHVLSPVDLAFIQNSGSVQERLNYYKVRLPDWVVMVRAVISNLNKRPFYASKIGVLGISLGAQIATLAADKTLVDALVLVDGTFPNGMQPRISLPPLHLIWGSDDQVFPVSIGQTLLRKAQVLGGSASLKIYKGGAHNFFLKPETSLAQEAHRDVARFFASQLIAH